MMPLTLRRDVGIEARTLQRRHRRLTEVTRVQRRRDQSRHAGHLHGGGIGSVGGQNSNVSGRTLGGGLGFGLLGSALSQSSKYVGMAFGYYGLGWSVFSTVIARGQEVQFDKNAVIDIGFNPRTSTTAKK